MDISLNKNNQILISLKKKKEKINIKLSLNSIIEIDEFKIDSAGEYEIKEIFIEGIIVNEKFFYLLDIEKIKICYLPFKIKDFKLKDFERIGNINLLIMDVSKYKNSQELSEIILNIEPQIIIPIYEKEEELNEFLKTTRLNIAEIDFLNKFSINLKDLTSEKTRTILLNKK